jgi:hypothetical protein
MSQKELATVKKLAKEADRAAKVVVRNRFLIETYMSLQEAKQGKVRSHKSVDSIFKKLGI